MNSKPSPLLNTMSSSGLALAANLGATSYVDAVSSLGLNTTVAACVGCTFFVPVNAAFSSSNLSSYNISGQTGVLENHVSCHPISVLLLMLFRSSAELSCTPRCLSMVPLSPLPEGSLSSIAPTRRVITSRAARVLPSCCVQIYRCQTALPM